MTSDDVAAELSRLNDNLAILTGLLAARGNTTRRAQAIRDAVIARAEQTLNEIASRSSTLH